MRGEAFGELEGVGLWMLEEKNGITYSSIQLGCFYE
jgi:hypothetical protein